MQDEMISQEKCSLVKDEEKLEATRLKFIDRPWSFQQNILIFFSDFSDDWQFGPVQKSKNRI